VCSYVSHVSAGRQHFATQCFKNGWTATLPELIVVSQDALVPPQVRHEHIHMPTAQRLACLCYLLRTELGTLSETTKQVAAVNPSGGSVGDAFVVKETEQAIVFMDDVTSVEPVRAAIEAALAAQEHAPDAIISGTQRSVGVLLVSMSLEARAKAVEEYRWVWGVG
jgi:hypothetical protein